MTEWIDCHPARLIQAGALAMLGDAEFRVLISVKDLTYGMHGKPVDGSMTGGHYDPGFEQK